jgi:hypothetical protein
MIINFVEKLESHDRTLDKMMIEEIKEDEGSGEFKQ